VQVGGKPRILVDAGPGAFLRIRELALDLEEVDTVLLTPLHIDHSGDLPAFFNARALTSDGPIAYRRGGTLSQELVIREFAGEREARYEAAHESGVESLLLSHLAPDVLGQEAAVRKSIRASYIGPVAFASDKMHVPAGK
jgi:ribonuclease BN (tRNA processing enzyme)